MGSGFCVEASVKVGHSGSGYTVYVENTSPDPMLTIKDPSANDIVVEEMEAAISFTLDVEVLTMAMTLVFDLHPMLGDSGLVGSVKAGTLSFDVGMWRTGEGTSAVVPPCPATP